MLLPLFHLSVLIFFCPYDDCGTSTQHLSDTYVIHPTINNFITTCSLCSRTWFVCLLCEGNQAVLITESAANKHVFNRHHMKKRRIDFMVASNASQHSNTSSTTSSKASSPMNQRDITYQYRSNIDPKIF
jgi:hypothetical protein